MEEWRKIYRSTIQRIVEKSEFFYLPNEIILSRGIVEVSILKRKRRRGYKYTFLVR